MQGELSHMHSQPQVSVQALQPEIILNKVGKFLPYIFMEWGQLPNNKQTCGNFTQWVQNFYQGGYKPVHPGKSGRAASNDIKYWFIFWNN